MRFVLGKNTASPSSTPVPRTHARVPVPFATAAHTAWPFLGSRRMAQMLRTNEDTLNRKRVLRLMRKMGIAALGPKPRTTKPTPGHKIFPYLLRNMTIDRPNRVWASDISVP